MFRLDKSSDLSSDNEPKALVECIPGNDGSLSSSSSGQSFHLIGLLSNTRWQKFWNDSLQSENDSSKKSLSMLRSLILAIESMAKNSDIDDDEQMEKIKIENQDSDIIGQQHRIIIETENILLYTLKELIHDDNHYYESVDQQQTVRFQFDSNFNPDNNIDIIIYSTNSIDISEPLIYLNVNFNHPVDDDGSEATNIVVIGSGNQCMVFFKYYLRSKA